MKVKDLNDQMFILMEARLDVMFKKKEDYIILDTFSGDKLKGLKYKPLFSYFTQVNFFILDYYFQYLILFI